MLSWDEQFGRAKRFLVRIDLSSEHLAAHPDRLEYEDFMWAFFQNCWHLKDWIKNDSTVPKSVRDEVEDCTAGCSAIPICADLANRSKHLVLKRNPRCDAQIRGRTYDVHVGGGRDSVNCRYEIHLQGGTRRDALEVARSAIAEWEQLLANWGLTPK